MGDLERIWSEKKQLLCLSIHTNNNNRSERTNVKVCSLNKSQHLQQMENNAKRFFKKRTLNVFIYLVWACWWRIFLARWWHGDAAWLFFPPLLRSTFYRFNTLMLILRQSGSARKLFVLRMANGGKKYRGWEEIKINIKVVGKRHKLERRKKKSDSTAAAAHFL